MTEFSRRPALAGGGMVSRHMLQCKAIGTRPWVELAAAVRAGWSANAIGPAHQTHRGRPDFLFEDAATEREMRRP